MHMLVCMCVFYRQQTLYDVKCILMVYNDSSKQWLTCGNHPFVSHVYILHNAVDESYRFVGIAEQDGEVDVSDTYLLTFLLHNALCA